MLGVGAGLEGATVVGAAVLVVLLGAALFVVDFLSNILDSLFILKSRVRNQVCCNSENNCI